MNEELDSAHGLLRDKLDAIDAELNDVKMRLSRLYDALETGKLGLDDLAPRIKELKLRQDELTNVRVQTEADLVVGGVQHVDVEMVKSYARDLKNLLEDADFTQSKVFLRSFVKRMVIDGDKVRIEYHLPMPPEGKKAQSVSVLSIDTPSGPNITFAKPTIETFFELSIAPASSFQRGQAYDHS